MTLTLRTRVVLAACFAIVVAVTALGIAVSFLVEDQLRSSLDGSLRDRAAEVARLSASAPSVLTAPGSLDTSIGGEQLSIEVLDRHGSVVARSLSLGGSLLPTRVVGNVIASGRPTYANDSLGGRALRLYVAPLPLTAGVASGGAVIVAGTTDEIDETLHRLHLFALLSAVGAAALAAVVSLLLLRRALRPLERLSAGAAEIERTVDPGRRLPEPQTQDELGRLAATLNRMLRALEHARESERRFLADASHELRTPVTALRGNIEYLRRHGPDPALLADLGEDAERLSVLVADLLALSHEDASEQLDGEVRLDLLALAIGGGDPRIVAHAPGPVAARGDRAALERALSNLVENARRYGPPGGRITVTARQDDGVARLSVRDEGPGLTADEAAHAFERFWRGRRGTPGSGLGLAIVKATAERHGGRVHVSGPEFTIELPALTDLSGPAAKTNGKTNAATPKGRP
jgi:two-component system, OmpR family, sensor kinase